jgi:hypothetical protein
VINWQGTVISQYNQSATIQSLLYAINQWIDPTEDLQNFYDFIWNVDTAQGYGLDVWGRIVAVERVLRVQVNDPYFGFDEATILSAWPFNTTPVDPTGPQRGGILYQNEPLNANYVLSDDGYRTLILAKALFNIVNGSIPAMNQILINLFSDQGRAYIIDNQDMSMTYQFEFIPTPVDAAIISQSGVMPRPTGVSVTYSFVPSGALPIAAGSHLGGVGSVRANATVVTGVQWASARIGGIGGLRMANPTMLHLLLASTSLTGVGTLRASATTRFTMPIGGIGGVSANPTISPAPRVVIRGGGGGVRANPIVR